MKHRLISHFRDTHGPVTFRLRDTRDLRDPRQVFRFRRTCERRIPHGRALPLGRGLDIPYIDIDEGRERMEESAESFYGMGREFA